MATAVPDYSELYASSELLDITIVLAELAEHTPSQDSLATQLKLSSNNNNSSSSSSSSELLQTKELPGHSVVLYVCSSFCKSKLQDWRSGSGKMEIVLQMPAGKRYFTGRQDSSELTLQRDAPCASC
jgi:hypothetical protein